MSTTRTTKTLRETTKPPTTTRAANPNPDPDMAPEASTSTHHMVSVKPASPFPDDTRPSPFHGPPKADPEDVEEMRRKIQELEHRVQKEEGRNARLISKVTELRIRDQTPQARRIPKPETRDADESDGEVPGERMPRFGTDPIDFLGYPPIGRGFGRGGFGQRREGEGPGPGDRRTDGPRDGGGGDDGPGGGGGGGDDPADSSDDGLPGRDRRPRRGPPRDPFLRIPEDEGREDWRAAWTMLRGALAGSDNKHPKPEAFEGERDGPARTFLQHCDLYFLDKPDAYPRNINKVRFALLLLKGRAAQWARPILAAHMARSHDRVGPHVRWREFKNVFAINFIDPNLEFNARMKLAKIRQTTSAADYTARFNELVVDADYHEDASISTLYYQGLKDSIKDVIAAAATAPTTYHEMHTTAVRIDTRLFNREQERRATRSSASSTTSSWRQTDAKVKSEPRGSTPARAPRKGPLTSAQKEERRRKGLCLYCGQSGHFARDCPSSSKKAAATEEAEIAAVDEEVMAVEA